MNRKVRLLTAFCLFWLSVLAFCQNKEVVFGNEHRQLATSSVVVPDKQPQKEATLSDAMHLYRICSSRPQRVVSKLNPKNEKSFSFCGNCFKHLSVHVPNTFDCRCLIGKAFFWLSVSRYYYVIALRRILC